MHLSQIQTTVMLQPVINRTSPSLFRLIKNLSHLNDHGLKLDQLLIMPELMNNTDIRALYHLSVTLMEDTCLAVSDARIDNEYSKWFTCVRSGYQGNVNS